MSRKEFVKELDKEQRIRKHNVKKKGENKQTFGLKDQRARTKDKRTERKDWVKDYEVDTFDEEFYMS